MKARTLKMPSGSGSLAPVLSQAADSDPLDGNVPSLVRRKKKECDKGQKNHISTPKFKFQSFPAFLDRFESGYLAQWEARVVPAQE